MLPPQLIAQDSILEDAALHLADQHRCHTVLLYGSRARGDHNETSDYDLIGVRRRSGDYRWADVRHGAFIDAFVFGEQSLRRIGERHAHMTDATIVIDKIGYGARLVRRLSTAGKRNAPQLSPSEVQVREVWIRKMLARARQDDLEGRYRRTWLQEALLPEYFDLRGLRYQGPRKGLRWLEANDRQTFLLLAGMLRHPTDLEILSRLVERVLAFRR